ncbi:hypothetical protein [[Erwinia] mediterraneensis]|uniref:hypothetical protein n=1 Tax=[Erwinia] mediterraneensis TaxID=2161819 RepID=UPI001030B61A|nr:hypothetical protein [[Erwinia] mediterraneensis]
MAGISALPGITQMPCYGNDAPHKGSILSENVSGAKNNGANLFTGTKELRQVFDNCEAEVHSRISERLSKTADKPLSEADFLQHQLNNGCLIFCTLLDDESKGNHIFECLKNAPDTSWAKKNLLNVFLMLSGTGELDVLKEPVKELAELVLKFGLGDDSPVGSCSKKLKEHKKCEKLFDTIARYSAACPDHIVSSIKGEVLQMLERDCVSTEGLTADDIFTEACKRLDAMNKAWRQSPTTAFRDLVLCIKLCIQMLSLIKESAEIKADQTPDESNKAQPDKPDRPETRRPDPFAAPYQPESATPQPPAGGDKGNGGAVYHINIDNRTFDNSIHVNDQSSQTTNRRISKSAREIFKRSNSYPQDNRTAKNRSGEQDIFIPASARLRTFSEGMLTDVPGLDEIISKYTQIAAPDLHGMNSQGTQTDAPDLHGMNNRGTQTDALHGMNHRGTQTDISDLHGMNSQGTQTDAPDLYGMNSQGTQIDALHGMNSRGTQTGADALHGLNPRGTQTDVPDLHGMNSQGTQTDALHGMNSQGTQTDAHDLHGMNSQGTQTDALHGMNSRGTQNGAGDLHGINPRGTQTDALHGMNHRGTQTDALHEMNPRGIQTGTGNLHGINLRGTQTDALHGIKPRGTQTDGPVLREMSGQGELFRLIPRPKIRLPEVPQQPETMETQKNQKVSARTASFDGVRQAATSRLAGGDLENNIQPSLKEPELRFDPQRFYQFLQGKNNNVAQTQATSDIALGTPERGGPAAKGRAKWSESLQDIFNVNKNGNGNGNRGAMRTDGAAQISRARTDRAHNSIGWPLSIDTAMQTDRPGQPLSTAMQTDSPGQPLSTGMQTDSPGQPLSTAMQTDSPGQPLSTGMQTDSPGQPLSTAMQTDSPGQPLSTSMQTDSPGQPLSTAMQTDGTSSPEKVTTHTQTANPPVYPGRVQTGTGSGNSQPGYRNSNDPVRKWAEVKVSPGFVGSIGSATSITDQQARLPKSYVQPKHWAKSPGTQRKLATDDNKQEVNRKGRTVSGKPQTTPDRQFLREIGRPPVKTFYQNPRQLISTNQSANENNLTDGKVTAATLPE